VPQGRAGGLPVAALAPAASGGAIARAPPRGQRKPRRSAKMDKKNLEGELEQAKGRLKETAGVVSGDRKLEVEGKLHKLKGKIKTKAGDLRQGIKDKLDELDQPKK